MTPRWRLAIPLTFLITLHVACLFGGFLAPNSALKQNRDLAWAPPTKLRFIDAQGKFHWRPFVYPLVEDPVEVGRYHEDYSNPSRVRLLVHGDEYQLAGIFASDFHFIGVNPPAKLHLLGTDSVGRDVFARTLSGGRASLFTGLLAGALAILVGTALGGLAGYLGGGIDSLVMRVVDLFLALPWLYLLLAIRAFLPLELTPLQSFLVLVAVVGLLGWAIPARLVRGVFISARARLFVEAAKGLGAKPTRLLRMHVLPQALPVVATQAAILIPSFALAEITLSFLGLGLADPLPSWGGLLDELRSYHTLTAHRWMLMPAVPLLTTFAAYYALNKQPAAT